MSTSLVFRLGILAVTVSATSITQAAEQTLYVATYQHIYVYTLGASAPRVTIDHGLAGISQIAIDRAGKRYAANFGTPLNFYKDSSVTEYERGHDSPFLIITDGAESVTGIAVDDFGDVFASSYYLGTVSVYRPGGATPVFEFKKGLTGPGLLALQGCHLFVESGYNDIVRFPESDLLTVTPPGKVPTHAIVTGGPFTVADDGTVYSGGFVVYEDVGYEEFVAVFAPGATKPFTGLILSTGRNAAFEPYVAVSGDSLYASAPDINTVFEYSISDHLKLVRTITEGLNQPGPLAVDDKGNLYVGDPTEVLVYAPKETSPSQTIILPDIEGTVGLVIAK